MSWVEAGREEADTTEVTTLVEDGSTVTVLATWDADEKTSDDTEDATADEKDEKDDWAASGVVVPAWATVVERKVDEAGVVMAAIGLSVANKEDGARPLYLSSWTCLRSSKARSESIVIRPRESVSCDREVIRAIQEVSTSDVQQTTRVGVR